jgi:hypothetical protein
MSRTETQGLLRKLLVLGVLLMCLTFVASDLGGRNAGAAICCDQCWLNYDNCMANCNGNPTCETGCVNTFRTCYRYCDPFC